MEAHGASDVDLLIVADDRHESVSDGQADRLMRDIRQRLKQGGFRQPKPDGIFSVCARTRDLLDPGARGRISERLVPFGQRMHLLLDAQPLIGNRRLIALQKDLLQWYSETRVMTVFEEAGPFHWLWQDVQRYWRSLRSRTYRRDRHDANRFLVRNVKLRSSRMMQIFAFLLILDDASRSAASVSDQSEYLVHHLHRTPAERLVESGMAIGDWDRVWCFLREAAQNGITDVPDDVRAELQRLAEQAADIVKTRCDGREGTAWIL